MIYKHKEKKVAFTLTELAVTLIILLLVAGIVLKETIEQAHIKANVEKIKVTYSLLEKATMAWQAEQGCTDDVTMCIRNARNTGTRDNEIFNNALKYLPVVAATVDIDAKGRHVDAENIVNVEWLPYETKTPDGNSQSNSAIGVSKFIDKNIRRNAFYLLRNGVTINVNFSDYDGQTGYGFFDIDGKEGENKIGVDVFPFSIGANIPSKHPLYNDVSKKFNPYFVSNAYREYDLCNLKYHLCTNEKMSSNPTFYVLKWNKLP